MRTNYLSWEFYIILKQTLHDKVDKEFCNHNFTLSVCIESLIKVFSRPDKIEV